MPDLTATRQKQDANITGGEYVTNTVYEWTIEKGSEDVREYIIIYIYVYIYIYASKDMSGMNVYIYVYVYVYIYIYIYVTGLYVYMYFFISLISLLAS